MSLVCHPTKIGNQWFVDVLQRTECDFHRDDGVVAQSLDTISDVCLLGVGQLFVAYPVGLHGFGA